MARPKSDQSRSFLMLDKDTFDVVGKITGRQVQEELGKSKAQFDYFIRKNGADIQNEKYLFRSRYVLVEEDFKEDEDEEIQKLICELDETHGKNQGTCYYVTSKGRFIRKTRKGHELELHVWKNKGKWIMKTGLKERIATRVYAKAFLGMKDNEECILQGNVWDVSKIIVGTPSEIRRITGSMSGNSIRVGLFVNGNLAKEFPSIGACARYLGYTREGLRIIVHGQTKNPQFDVRRI